MILILKKFLDKHKFEKCCEVTFGEGVLQKTVKITYELLNDIEEDKADDFAVEQICNLPDYDIVRNLEI
ncbi:MAG: hypothetical protein A2V66_16830 [Ignavibacteria bacterium RBG_13_36_8]|nr:MAG: hypothetical protein A2V66_16830 [Ignavibacteria bacterium RBG_13_36_8]